MHLKCWLENIVLTRKSERIPSRNEVYTVRKYLANTGHAADPYFVGRFELHGPPDRCGWIWTNGRFKGYKNRTPLFIGYSHEFVEPLQIPEWYVDRLRNAGGNGKKPRWAESSKGYIWLPDSLQFSDPMSILDYAMSANDQGLIHTDKPNPQCWPKWELGSNVVLVKKNRANPL